MGDARLDGIRVVRHVPRTASAGGVDGAFQSGRLEVRRIQFGGFGSIGDVACSSSTRRCHSRHGRRECWGLRVCVYVGVVAQGTIDQSIGIDIDLESRSRTADFVVMIFSRKDSFSLGGAEQQVNRILICRYHN